MRHWWNNTEGGVQEVIAENLGPVPLCLPTTPHTDWTGQGRETPRWEAAAISPVSSRLAVLISLLQ